MRRWLGASVLGLSLACGGEVATTDRDLVNLAVNVTGEIDETPQRTAEILRSFDLTPAGYDSLLFAIALSPRAAAEYQSRWRGNAILGDR